MKFTIHGVRGSVPTPGIEFVKYGGNTSCFEIETCESQIFCDAGTGFRSAKLLRDKKNVWVFLTHFHHDHIQGFPFNPGLFSKGQKISVSSALHDRKTDGPAIAVKPFVGNNETVATFATDVTNDLQKYLNQKDWIDSLIQQNPSDEDYQLIGTVSPSGPNFEVDIVLKAPGGKTLWHGNTGGPMGQIALVSDTIASQISSAVFLEVTKVKDKYK